MNFNVQNQQKQRVKHESAAWQLTFDVHKQEFYPNELQPHKIKSKPISGSDDLLYDHPNLNDSF